jgi:hypothetical protein
VLLYPVPRPGGAPPDLGGRDPRHHPDDPSASSRAANEVTAMKASGISSLPTRDAARRGVGPRRQPGALRGRGSSCSRTRNRVGERELRRDQGAPAPLVELHGTATGSWAATRALLQLRVPRGGSAAAGDTGAAQVRRPVPRSTASRSTTWTARAGRSRTTCGGARRCGTACPYDVESGWAARAPPTASSTTRAFEGIRTRELEPPSYFRKQEPESETLDFGALQSALGVLASLGHRRREASACSSTGSSRSRSWPP